MRLVRLLRLRSTFPCTPSTEGRNLDVRALVVDDSRTVRVRVRRLLEGIEDFNFEVSEAADGSEALKLLEKTAIDRLPDVILLDRNMPRVSGDACIRILKSDPVWKTIPVIFLTAQADKAEVAKGLTQLGSDDYLAKPFDPAEMLARVKALVRAKRAEDESRALTNQRKANAELRTARIELAETQAVAMMTRAFEKFVPKQFLQRIARDGLENLKPG